MTAQALQPGSWWRHRASGTVEQMIYTEYVHGQMPTVGLRNPEAGGSRMLTVDELLSGAYELA